MKLILLALICIFLQSCSVSTAMTGRKIPDLSDIYIGADYDKVSRLIGVPDEVKTIYNGRRLYIYRNLSGLEPSTLEFASNIILDITTLGLWELVPYKSSKFSVYYITYDKNWKVDSINKYLPINS